MSVRGPHYVKASELGSEQRFCTCCNRYLTGRKVRLLELDQRTNTYHDFGGVPVEKSQGWFQFGFSCAKTKIADARAALAKAEERS